MKLKTLQIEQEKQKKLRKNHLKNQKNLLKVKTAQAQKTQIQKKKAVHLAICLMRTPIHLAILTAPHQTNLTHLQAILMMKKAMNQENLETQKNLILTTNQKMKTQMETQKTETKIQMETQTLKMKNQAMSQRAETKEKTRNLNHQINHQKSHLRIHLT